MRNSTLRFAERHDRYSIYTRPDGTEVFIAHGFPRVFLIDGLDNDWMLDAWHLHAPRYERHRPAVQADFLAWMRDQLVDPDEAEEVLFCEKCYSPTHEEEGSSTYGDGFACDSCIESHYTSCASCDEYARYTTSTLSDAQVCEYCRDSNYTWCDNCEGYYYHEDNNHDHDEDTGCHCVSPVLSFGIRNDGNGMLYPDDRVTVSLPAGTLDLEGLAHIERYLDGEGMFEVARLVGTMDARWQTRQGNFTKRLSRAVYQKHGQKISPEVLSKVGSIARDHSKPVDYVVATTRDFNQSAADFGHEDSCYWGSYSSSRCTLKSHGAFGLRSFDEDGDVSGRAWVMPLVYKGAQFEPGSSFQPTFNTESPDAFVVFNGYGDLGGYTATRIISHMAGMTYRKVSFSAAPMFINGDAAYLVAPEELASQFTDGSVRLDVSPHYNLYQSELDAAKELANV